MDYQRLEVSSSDHDAALSLCDLSIILTNQENETGKGEAKSIQDSEEFDFGSLKFDMSAADEVFFQGQILPVCPSRRSDANENCPRPEMQNPNQIISRSISSSKFTFTSGNTSSGSSSSRSQQSSSSPRMEDNQSVQNQSPRPRKSSLHQHRYSSGVDNKKSYAWKIFRSGLVLVPEIDLHELKNSNMGNKNSRRESSCSLNYKMNKKQRLFETRMLLSGCKCSVATISLDNRVKRKKKAKHEVIEEKMKELDIKQKEEEKQEMSSSRACEWLKGLSWHTEESMIS